MPEPLNVLHNSETQTASLKDLKPSTSSSLPAVSLDVGKEVRRDREFPNNK